METLRGLWSSLSPYWTWLIPLLGVLIMLATGAALTWWLRRRPQQGTTSLGTPPPMRSNRLRKVHHGFLGGLPWLQRAAVRDLPCTVVLGPAGSGKSKLIALDVDWQRQSRQFLPSHTSDSLLKIYLGPDLVVQELSASLLEDDTPQARRALRRLWKDTFAPGQHALAVLVLDIRWLAEAPPDEIRSTAQLLRGKLNLLAEIRRVPVETRLCLTHMDTLEGFKEFAQLLHTHRMPLAFALPPHSGEGQVASLIQAQEQYLALGLTSLPMKAFERLERFYSQSHRPFEALTRFTTALLEGGTLAFVPRLSRVYLSSPSARAAGVLSVPTEAHEAQALRQRYLRTHFKRSAMLAAVCSMPMLAAYAHFSWRLAQARENVSRFEHTVERMRGQGQEEPSSLVQAEVLAAGQAMEKMWKAIDYWPLLHYSFSTARKSLSERLSNGIRDVHLRPALERCHKQPSPCRPEEAVFLLAVLHASSGELLGDFVCASLSNRKRCPISRQGKQVGVSATKGSGLESKRSWITAVNLVEDLVEEYVITRDNPWQPSSPEDDWAYWPFSGTVTLEDQLTPWQSHLQKLQNLLRTQSEEPLSLDQLDKELEALQEKRLRLQAQLEDSALFVNLPQVIDLLRAADASIDRIPSESLSSAHQTVEWLNKNRAELAAVLRMEEEARMGLKAVRKMSVAELLVRDGVWLPSASSKERLRVTVTRGPIEFHPRDISRGMLQGILRYHEETGHLPFSSARNGEAAPNLFTASLSEERLKFDTRIRPLVDQFTQLLREANLPGEEALQRQEHVRRHVDHFSLQYRQSLFERVNTYSFVARTPAELYEKLSHLTEPSSELVDMLREVAKGATLEPLEGPYYESLRDTVATFNPIVRVMKLDENGASAFKSYQDLVAQLSIELHGVPRGGERSSSALPGPATSGRSGRRTALSMEQLSPLGRIALSMMLEEEGSYLRKVDAWLEQKNLTGDLRKPFRQPFLEVRRLGRQEVERFLQEQWDMNWTRMLQPLMSRYPFNPEAVQEVEPSELEILRRQDGAFWSFVNRVIAPICEEHGTEWVLRGAVGDRLALPKEMLPTLSQLSRLSRALWDSEGRSRPLMLQVMPLPLPTSPQPGSFVTLAALKCGKTAAFAYNQSPSWQTFPLDWWDQQTASLVLELRSPKQQAIQYTSLQQPRSAWSCFRLLEASLPTGAQQRLWQLRGRSAKNALHTMELRFGLKGEPWTLFREVQ
jgi:type VI secretion system protein ImpL